MVKHDVSHELRDSHGKWTRGGAALRRMVNEAVDSQSQESVLAKIHSLQEGQGRNINGHWVDRPASEGHKYRVKLKTTERGKRDAKVYGSPEEAARAIHEGRHGPTVETAPGSPPNAPPRREPPAGKAPFTGRWNAANEDVKGSPEHTFNRLLDNGVNSMPAKRMVAQAYQNGTSEVEEGLFVQYDKATDKYSVHVYAPKRKPEEETFRKSVTTGGVHHPKSLEVKVQASAEDKKRMRQQVLKATTKQAEVTPDLVSRTAITVTKAPHGRRGTLTLASHTGQGNTLHVKPEVLIGNNADNVLKYQVDNGWWVPTDNSHDLSMNVNTHEFGHGTHGELNRLGILKANRANGTIHDEEEIQFWRELAETMGARPPKPGFKDSSGRPGFNIAHWHSENKSVIEQKVSRYSGSNMNEMIAELWTEYRLSSHPRPPAKYFGDYVTRYLKLHEQLIA